ncbi:MAG: hypothetical protein LQ351_005254 [Letrouitia transgressa]|nr:MAG: hypothetical protein LQ351_005254 [Letrouitia transgressa]
MPPAGSRKRPAPGASPSSEQPRQSSPNRNITSPSSEQPQQTSPNHNIISSEMASNPYLQWSQPVAGHPRPQASTNFSQLPYQSIGQEQFPSNQLTRRPLNQDVIQRAPYGNGPSEQWPNFQSDAVQQHNETALQQQADDLDQKALAAQRDAQSKRKQIPPFVQKLRSFLDDPQNAHLIKWSENGDSFIVVDEDEFASTLIPELFKHKKYPSFVRQLNMYGFHKKVGLSDNSMRASERKNKTPSEYYNPYFKRDRPILVWLISKPKNAQSKSSTKGAVRSNQDAGNYDDDADEVYDPDHAVQAGDTTADSSSGIHHGRQPLMIGDAVGETPPQDIQRELQAIRKQQQMIASLLQKTRAEHEQLYGQAAKFQELHDRHENSINAILTFLATVYNRSLEGKGGQNLGTLFGTIPQDPQGQGNVVDVGNYSGRNLTNAQTQGGFRRQPLLLAAPPVNNQGISVATPSVSADSPASQGQNTTYLTQSQGAANSPAVQEVFDRTPSNRSSQSPPVKPETSNEGQLPEADILSMINSTNATTSDFPGGRMDFPQVLSHLQTANGQSPLSPNQRNDVLRLMASSSAATPQNNNALTSPSPPMPNMVQYQQSKERLDRLQSALKQQDDKVKELSQYLAPLSPSGSIPGISETQNYGDPGGADSLDLDQFLNNTGDYFNENGNAPFDFGSNDGIPDFSFDQPGDITTASLSMDGAGDDDHDRVVETVESSEATSPANTVDENNTGLEDGQSPRKKRRKGLGS